MKVITPSALVERLKVNVSLARAALKYLVEVILSKIFFIINVLFKTLGGKNK